MQDELTMLSDGEIIRRVQAGERELFGELHTRHHERVYRFVAQSIWQREAAQDVACEVWLRAYNAVDRFEIRSGASVLAWLLRIAANLVTDYRRRLGPETESWEENEERLAPSLVSPGTESQFLQRERARAVQDAFRELSAGDQQIIYLAHQDGMSSAEIAQALGKPSISAVTSHLHRAMTHLRERLRRQGWLNEDGDRPSTHAA
jgi:RNA polymerase sigma-70 factor (ECF subfamily)